MGAGLQIAAFGYHEVTDDPTTSGFQRPGAMPYKLGRGAFAAHLDALASGPCVPTLVPALDWTRPGRHVLITFDDGGKSAMHASEELCRRGWRGHFFITTSQIGRRTFLNTADIRALRSCGHVVGSHSHTHPPIFRDLSVDRMAAEWRISAATLADLLGEPCLVASVPSGDISATVLTSAGAAGVRYLFTSEPWLRPRQVDGCWVLGRVVLKVGTTPEQVRRLAQFRGWPQARAVRAFKAFAGRALPPLYRWYVARRERAWTSPETSESVDASGRGR